MKIYVIHDTKANTYSTPFFQQTDVHAIRVLAQEVNRPDPQNSFIAQHPQDYVLVRIGEYDPDTGVIESTMHDTLTTAAKLLKRA